MVENEVGIENYYRIGPMYEKKILIEFKDNFYGITLSAHLIAHFYDSLSKFVKQLGKPFFIDPMTYVFARDLNNIKKRDKVKISFQKFINFLPQQTQQILERRELLPIDFYENKREMIDIFARNILEFQRNFIKAINKKEDPTTKTIRRYREILQRREGGDEEILPSFLTSAYFYFESIEDPWYNISLSLAKKIKQIEQDDPIYPIICFSKELLLNADEIKQIIDDYKEFEGIIFWINDFNEQQENVLYLKQFNNFTQELVANFKVVYNLYGDYYSLLLTKRGLKGYSRGVGMSEKRNVDASTQGGGNPERYYLPFLHTYTSKTYAREFFAERTDLLCNCDFCEELKKEILLSHSQNDLAEEFFNRINYVVDAKKHFILSHNEEIKLIEELSLKDLTSRVIEQIEETKKYRLFLYNLNNLHLTRWHSSLFR